MAASLDKRGVIGDSIDVEGKENKKEGQVVNMSYCRFENTYLDLQECAEALDASDGVEGVEKSANEYEKRYVRRTSVITMTGMMMEMTTDTGITLPFSHAARGKSFPRGRSPLRRLAFAATVRVNVQSRPTDKRKYK